MAYADFQALPEFREKQSGAGVEILIFDAANPGAPIIGAASSLNATEEFATTPVEEAGNDGVDEFVQDRHTGRADISAFYTPAWAESVPTRQSFIGKSYTVIERVAVGRAGAGTVLRAFTKCRITGVSNAHGARGPMTTNLSLVFSRAYNGAEWAVLAGA
jgi:hypothetical protein